MKKYDVYLGDFNPRKGSAQSGIRPCVIIQSNLFNEAAQTCVVIPLTSVLKKVFPSEFLIEPSAHNGLTNVSRFLGDKITTIDKRYLVKHLGSLEQQFHPQVREAISVALDLDDDF